MLLYMDKSTIFMFEINFFFLFTSPKGINIQNLSYLTIKLLQYLKVIGYKHRLLEYSIINATTYKSIVII